MNFPTILLTISSRKRCSGGQPKCTLLEANSNSTYSFKWTSDLIFSKAFQDASQLAVELGTSLKKQAGVILGDVDAPVSLAGTRSFLWGPV